ncbi:copper amine oxidase N-terminal domain-containing protein [Paenibacillus polymyxa]|uniref:copper amine oxidase N-terminal domain-containing protein n=1 Tax=Paenibacillus polymyxa TaxID=1406 RepID=UPI0025B6F8C2|nr:copper amine oxidase N-terminal domain-containing protein [Paenibacillus polymyxa]MDN4079344.1 copper amine oxidase N-terminal domain-containing protein [Paenibacillus polymyxa]MDN4115198.1 copper amine oxidase N-terminal domain-containing protein [Paenibacillus polymyxa]
MANGQNPIVIDNVTLVPIRTVSLIPNLKVDWDNKSKTVMVTDSDTKNKLNLTVSSNSAYVNDKKVSVGVNPTVKEGAVYVPFRFIGEALNAKVMWQPDSKTVVTYKPSQTLLQRYASNKLEESRKELSNYQGFLYMRNSPALKKEGMEELITSPTKRATTLFMSIEK